MVHQCCVDVILWNIVKCHRMHWVTADVLPLHALLTHVQEGLGGG